MDNFKLKKHRIVFLFCEANNWRNELFSLSYMVKTIPEALNRMMSYFNKHKFLGRLSVYIYIENDEGELIEFDKGILDDGIFTHHDYISILCATLERR